MCLQQEAGRAADYQQTVQQLQKQLQNSKVAAKHSEQQLQEQVQHLRRSSSDKGNSLVQLQQRCQSTEIQLQVKHNGGFVKPRCSCRLRTLGVLNGRPEAAALLGHDLMRLYFLGFMGLGFT